jgi:hypothetical protein
MELEDWKLHLTGKEKLHLRHSCMKFKNQNHIANLEVNWNEDSVSINSRHVIEEGSKRDTHLNAPHTLECSWRLAHRLFKKDRIIYYYMCRNRPPWKASLHFCIYSPTWHMWFQHSLHQHSACHINLLPSVLQSQVHGNKATLFPTPTTLAHNGGPTSPFQKLK